MERPLIVIVDGYEERARPVEEELCRNFDCLSIYSAEEALGEIRRARPAAVIVDFPFPTADRRCLSAVLQDDPELSGIPVVAYSAWDFPKTREKAAALGCDSFVARAKGPEALARVIDEMLLTAAAQGSAA